MRRAITALIGLMLTLSLAACQQQERAASATGTTATTTAVSPATTLTPEQLGELGAEIRKNPAKADELLTRRGMTRDQFERAIRDLTENPEASKRYADAYHRASA